MSLSNLSSQHLRDVFKHKMDDLISLLDQARSTESVYLEIQKTSEHLEKTIHDKTKLLESDFNDQTLSGDYLRSVTESFDDLDRLLRSSKTFIDAVQGKTRDELLEDIKRHHQQTLIPLLNILAKLENDYISLATQTISQKQNALAKVEIEVQKLKMEEKCIKNSILVFNKQKRVSELVTKIRFLDLKRQILKLSLHHDKLNLYYFNHDHPVELKELKHKADQLRSELSKFKEVRYA